MNLRSSQSSLPNRSACFVIAIACVVLVMPASTETWAQTTPDTAAPGQEAAPPIPADQMDSLVAPVALYPDPLLSQTLVASTYPVELIQLQQWMTKNPGLKDQALADAVAKQPWDPSIQGLAAFPDVVTKLAENIQWTSDLGNAFLAQQADVMTAVQRMRAKAQGTGTLKTSEQQKVETQTTSSGQQAIVIEPADPQVVYVLSYDPAVAYGAPAYPYPPVTYPGYIAGGALAFGTGLALGAAWGGGWGYNCGWNNGGDVNVNVNNKYVNNYNKKNNINNANGNWQHNPQHRGNAPYGNKQTASKYGGTARGEARPAGGAGGAGKPGGVGGVGGAGKPGGAGGVGGAGKAGGAGGVGGVGGAGKPGGAGGAGGVGKPGGAGAKPASKAAGANSVGNHQPSKGGGGGSAFGGGSGPSAKAASSRGGSSMGSGGGKGGGGGGGRGGGGGHGGGGGGRRR